MSASRPDVPLVGRADELRSLRELVTGLAHGQGAAVAVVGEAGIGKTRLVRAVTGEATSGGVSAVVGRCVPGGMVAYRPVREAVLTWSRVHDLSSDETALPWLRGLRPLLEADEPEPVSPLLVAESVLRLVGERTRPGLLVLEDLHWADAETLAVAEYLADHTAESALGLLLTLRPGELATADDLLRRLRARAAVTAVRLQPLDLDATRTWTHARLGPVSPRVVSLVHDRSGGSPLFLGELLDELAAVPADQLEAHASSALPAGVRESVRAKLLSLPRTEVEVVQVAALVGLDDLGLLGAASGHDDGEVRSALAAGADVGLLESDPVGERHLQFRHDLVREAVLAATPVDRRTVSARRALGRVAPAELAGLDDEEQVDQVVRLAEWSGDAALATRAAVRGAVLAFDHWALSSAERWLSRARSSAGTDPALVNSIDLVQLRVSASAGQGSVVRRVGEALLARLPVDDDESRLEVLLRLAQVAGDEGDVEAARQRLTEAEPLLPVVADPCSYTKHRLAGAQAALAAGERDLATRLATAARDLAGRDADQRDLQCSALAVLGSAAWPDTPAADAAWRQGLDLAAAHDMRLWQGRMAAWRARAAVADLTGDDLLEQAHAAARDAGAALLDASASTLEAELALLRWQPDDVRRHLADASDRLAGLTPPQQLSTSLSVVADLFHVLAGEANGSRAAGPVLAALLSGDLPPPFDPESGATVEGALDDLVRLDPTSPPGRGLVRDAVARVARRRSATDADDTAVALREAVEVLDPAPWLRALLVLRVAPAVLEAGPSPVLRDLLRDAIEVLDALPTAGGAAERARDLIRRAGAPYPRRTSAQAGVPEHLRRRGITAREWQVMELVGEGLTSRQIAERLYLSPRTVEKHVERMLSKTGVGNRAALAALSRSADVT